MKRKRISESSTASVQPDAVGTTLTEDYDVFLNFRGADTRYGFVDCLHKFLTAAGIRVFLDDEALHIGDDIGDELRMAIDSSRLYMPIFSRNYASSKWCLMELARMVKRARKSFGKGILPVFFDVEPEDVKLKAELYAEDLLRHEESFGSRKVRKWRKALRKVSKMKGWNLQSNQGQWSLISEISKHIDRRLELKHRILPNHFTGMEEQTQDIMDALDCGSRDVRFVVIHGMGGIGKTTLASVVFNKIHWQFQECSFLSNVRESAAGNGIVNLQNKFLNDIQRFSPRNFCDANDAMNCLETSLRNKDVLVVLDDVSDMDQIRNLIGMGDWLGLGSRVIITTRNSSCIPNVEEIKNNVVILLGKKIYIHRMRVLGFDSSLLLLCRHAFDVDSPPHGYEQLSRDILSFTRGVPLALKVIGSYLRRKSVAIWKEMLKKLKKVPHDCLYRQILMSSYEMLCDGTKEIFLDIAFFLANHDKTTASYYWEARGLYPDMSVYTLVSYALVEIDHSNKLLMHDLLRELGREVVRQQSIKDLGTRSRICNEDAKQLLSREKGTEYVKALTLDSTHAHNFTPAQLLGLSDLQFLELCGGNFIGQFGDHCLSELVWLSWRDCSLDFRWANFCFEKLVVLRLSESKITDTWAGWEQLKTAISLKVLELEGLNLIAIPDLASFPSLERLVVHQCKSLVQIDPSIGNLECLDSLEKINSFSRPSDLIRYENRHKVLHMPSSICNLKALSRLEIVGFELKQLPENIGELKGLKVMWINGCQSLQNLPYSIGDLDSLCELRLIYDGISELPESIGKLGNLNVLDVRYNQLRGLPAAIGALDRLEALDASFNRDLQGEIPSEFGRLKSLKYLGLSCTGIRGLPSSIHQLSRLESLNLEYCNEIRVLPDFPTGLTKLSISCLSWEIMYIEECKLLRNLPDSIGDLEFLCELHLPNAGITELPQSIGKLGNLKVLNVNGNRLMGLPATIGALDRLKVLNAGNNRDLQEEIPSEFGRLKSLKYLDLSCTGICGLPSSIDQLSRLESLYLVYCNKIRELPDLPTGLKTLWIASRSLKAPPKLSSVTNLIDLMLLNGCNQQVLAWNVTDYLSVGLDQLSQLRELSLSCRNPSVVSLLPSGLNSLKLYHSTSLSSWERLSNLEGLSTLSLHESSDTEIQLDGLESLKNLTELAIDRCEFLETIHDISRLQRLRKLALYSCPKLVEIGGLTQPLESLQRLFILCCDSIRCLPDRSSTESPSELYLGVHRCSKLRDFEGPYNSYSQGGSK